MDGGDKVVTLTVPQTLETRYDRHVISFFHSAFDDGRHVRRKKHLSKKKFIRASDADAAAAIDFSATTCGFFPKQRESVSRAGLVRELADVVSEPIFDIARLVKATRQ
jgi:hypothetical protein